MLECGWLEVESGAFVKSAHNVHVLYCLSACAFEEVVNRRCDEQVVAMLFHPYNCFVCVDSLFEIHISGGYVGKRLSGIKAGVGIAGFLY